MDSVRYFADKVQKQFQKVHLLINNAGILGVPYKETKDGFESQMAVNYLGHFLLTHLLMPQLKAGALNNGNKTVRIVNVSSCVNNVGLIDYQDFQSKWELIFNLLISNQLAIVWLYFRKCFYSAQSYANSKLVQLMSTKHMETILRASNLNIQTDAPHPGIVNTDIFQNSTSAYIPFITKLLYKVRLSMQLNCLVLIKWITDSQTRIKHNNVCCNISWHRRQWGELS